jgi:PhzF family phenazine biosynthesis protein
MIVDDHTPAHWMQQMAMEMNLSETAFVIQDKENFKIRYFTPTTEMPLCGHATLASAHIIYELGLKSKHEPINFKAAGGDLTVTMDGDWIVMNFPSYPIQKIAIPTNFQTALGFRPLEMYSTLYNWVIAVAAHERDISEATPNFGLMKESGLGNVIITAKSHSQPSDFVVRCFVPASGINEDPVTGSAHCALAPLWAEKLKKTELHSLQLSQRTGQLHLHLLNDRVEIKGRAVTVFEAQLRI